MLDEHRLSSHARWECFQRNSLWIYSRRTYLLKYFSVHIWLSCPFRFPIHEKLCIIGSHLPKPRASCPASDKQTHFTSPKTLAAPRPCWHQGSFEELLQKRELPLSPWALLQGRALAQWEELLGAQTSRATSAQAAQHGTTGPHHAVPSFNEPELCFEGLPSRVIKYGVMVSSCTVRF